MTRDRRRLGVFGGTFDPPHVAHVVVAAAAIHQLVLDELVVTVAGVPWQKVGTRPITDAETRLRMAQAAFEPIEAVTVSDMELRRRGNSYTVDTLRALKGDGIDLFLLIGSDTAEGLDTWEQPDELARLATIAVFPRRGYEGAEPPPGFAHADLALPGLEISSSDLRRRVAAGEPIDGLSPPAVVEIVRDARLYRLDDSSADAVVRV